MSDSHGTPPVIPSGFSNTLLPDRSPLADRITIAGESGITFTLGILDDIVGRCIRRARPNGERTRRIEFYDHIDWFAPALCDIANASSASSTSATPIDVSITIYRTGSGDPDGLVPVIPNSNIVVCGSRPSTHRLLLDLIKPPNPLTLHRDAGLDDAADSSAQFVVGSDEDVVHDIAGRVKEAAAPSKLSRIGDGGRVVVCVSGSRALTTEVANAVASPAIKHNSGTVTLHAEMFSL